MASMIDVRKHWGSVSRPAYWDKGIKQLWFYIGFCFVVVHYSISYCAYY